MLLPAEKADTLSRGRYLLCEWLRLADGSASSRARTAAPAAVVLAAVACAALAVLVRPVGWALVAAAAVRAWFALPAPGRTGLKRRTRREPGQILQFTRLFLLLRALLALTFCA